jgi:hypothetical protein
MSRILSMAESGRCDVSCYGQFLHDQLSWIGSLYRTSSYMKRTNVEVVYWASLYNVTLQGSKKSLILREVNEESVVNLLEKKDAMMDCDVAAFVYDRFELLYF